MTLPMRDILNTISRRVILAAGIGLIAVLIVATVVVLAVLRSGELERAERHFGNLATVLAEQAWQSVRAVELLARTTADELREGYLPAGRAPDRRLHNLVRERMEVLPSVRVVMVADARGDSVLHSSRFPVGPLNYSDREYFRAHLQRRIDGLYVGEPVFGRVTNEWLNAFSLRVEDGNGGFRGVVAVAVHLPYFENLFASLKLGPDGRVFLFREDGVVLATYPHAEKAIGRRLAEDPLFRQAFASDGATTQRRPGLLDSKPRVLAYSRLQGYPLVMTVSSTEESIMGAWRRDAWQIGAGAAAAVTFIAVALFFLLRQHRIGEALAIESRHAHQQVRESDERFRGIIEAAMDAIITVDEDQKIVMFNAAAEHVFGCPAEQAVGAPLERFIPERYRAAHREHVRRFGETRVTTRAMGGQLELYGLKVGGEEFPIDASISQITVEGKRLFTVILRDITRRRQAEEEIVRSHEELRELSAKMHEAREGERLRVARELHDELAQWLTAIKMDVSWLAARLPQDPPQLAARVEKLKGAVDTTVASVRRIASDLRPVMLDDLGLAAALEHLLHDLSQRTGIVVSLDAEEGEFDFGEPLASSLYRIAQEALTNVARHAEASEVQVTVAVGTDDRLVLAIRDNGKGYDEEIAAQRTTYGVLGIRERAYTLGGTVRIERVETGGTLVEIVIPAARYRKGEAQA
jgi:PAS domain S-box-containing protein